MHGHLRLAKLRGSLNAPNSPVQDLALVMLDRLEQKKAHEERLDLVKTLVVTPGADLDGIRTQFPEFFYDAPYEAAKKEDGTYDIDLIDDSEVEWHTPAAPEDDDALSRWIAQHEGGSFTGADL